MTLRRLADVSLVECVVLAQLAVLSLAGRIGLQLAGLSRLVEVMACCAERPRLRWLPVFRDRCAGARLARLADIAAALTGRQGRCLRRSLLLYWLLRARGEAAELLIGVRKDAGTLQGHAWVEVQGRVFGDDPGTPGRFAALLRS
jgi:hypothetical protein